MLTPKRNDFTKQANNMVHADEPEQALCLEQHMVVAAEAMCELGKLIACHDTLRGSRLHRRARNREPT